MKRCPKCKMVHSDADYFCRRCNVDLATGEPAPLRAIRKKSGEEVLRERIRNSGNLVKRPLAFLNKTAAKILAKFPAPKLEPKESEQVNALIYCMSCGGEMKPAAVPYYAGWMIYPFLALAAILFGLSFIFRALIIPGILSVAAFVVYLRLREELWLCGECGSYHKRRKKKPKPAGQGTEIRPA